MATHRTEAVLIGILERCSRSPGGCPLRSHSWDTGGIMVEVLAECGLLMIRENGRVVTTAKGERVLGALYRLQDMREPRVLH